MKRIAAHYFSSMQDISFDAESYSKFKYGSIAYSFAFGVELGKVLLEWCNEAVKAGETVLISGAPYNNIPIASTALAEYACMYLQTKRRDVEFKTFKIDREHSYDVDYGNMSAEEREKLISAETFYVDINHLKGEHIVLIDDILISGAHERNMRRMVDRWLISPNVVYAYYAVLKDSACCPTVEADLNYAYVKKDGSNIYQFMQMNMIVSNVAFNTRLVKFLLALDTDLFTQCMKYGLSDGGRAVLLKYAYANGYDSNPKYAENCKLLKEGLLHE